MGKDNKYLFDLHNFDSGAYQDEEPAAPVFSEDELAAGKTASFSEGYEKAKKEAQTARDTQIVQICEKLTTQIQYLFEQEESRVKAYQLETSKLVMDVFCAAFPILNDSFSLDQIHKTIYQVLENAPLSSAIHIELSPQDYDEVAGRLKPHIGSLDGKVQLVTHPDLSPGSFHIKWQDGGALRDTEKIKSDLVHALTHTLAQMNETSHT